MTPKRPVTKKRPARSSWKPRNSSKHQASAGKHKAQNSGNPALGEKRKQEVQGISIERLASDGSGVGYLDGKATFVPGLLPGETGRVKIIEEKKNYRRGELVDISDPSPERQMPLCPVYQECGGCDLQHLRYESTLTWKKQWVEDALSRIGGLRDIKIEPVLGMESPWRYRNKAVLHRDQKGGLGYYRPKTNDVVQFTDCLLLSKDTNQKIQNFKDRLGDDSWDIRTVTFRENSRGEGILFAESDDPKEFLYEYIDDLRFRVSPRAFLQVNYTQTAKLYALILEYAQLQGQEEVWDLYCGIGTITLMLAKRALKVIGIEENPHAVKDAGINAEENGITNARFVQGKVEDKLASVTGTPDIVVCDPPRAGMDQLVIERLIQLQPQKIIYVSCNPATLARDLKILTGGSANSNNQGVYTIQKVQPVDMFPWTAHVECVVLITRKND